MNETKTKYPCVKRSLHASNVLRCLTEEKDI